MMIMERANLGQRVGLSELFTEERRYKVRVFLINDILGLSDEGLLQRNNNVLCACDDIAIYDPDSPRRDVPATEATLKQMNDRCEYTIKAIAMVNEMRASAVNE